MTRRRDKNYTSAAPRPLPAEVARKGLLGRVAQASEASLFVLAAPSGYGKTTLLGQLARGSKHAVWLTLSERHTDLAALADELMTSVTSVIKDATFARIRKAVSEGAQVSALAVPIARELDDLGVNLRILVDQANLLGESAVSWLESFALALGEGHQLTYCAYDLASERIAAPLASGRALLLTTTDLAFSEEESRAYLKARGSAQDVSEVQRALEGWPAGIGLAAAEVGHIVSPDNLLETVFNRLPQAVREALPEASVLEIWREKDADKLGCKLLKGWLKEAQRSGLPLTPLSVHTYRPHTLVLERLEGELQNRPERYAELHTSAGDNARKNEDLVAALQHYRKAGHLAEAFEVAEELIPRLNDRQEYKLICKLLEPLVAFENNLPSEVAAYHGHALLRIGQLKRSKSLLEKLGAKGRGEPLTSIFLAKVFFEERQLVKMHATAKGAFKWVEKDIHLLHVQNTLTDALVELKRCEEALPIALDNVVRAEATRDKLRIANALTHLEVVHFYMRDYTSCEQAIKRALHCYSNLRMSISSTYLLLRNNLADVYLVQGRFAEAHNILSEILALPESKNNVKRPLFLLQLAYISEAMMNYEEANVHYQETLTQSIHYNLKFFVKRTKYMLSKLMRRSGNFEIARSLLDEAHGEKDIGDHDWTGESAHYEGLAAFDKGDMTKARQDFNIALIHPGHD